MVYLSMKNDDTILLLAPIVRNILDAGGNKYAETCGEPEPSTYPWPEQQDIRGGGVLPFTYFFQPLHSHIEILKDLRDFILKMVAYNIMAVSEI